jgi:hypothetical protein
MNPILSGKLFCRKIVLVCLAILLFHCAAFSQTRFYLNLNTAAPVSPAFNAGWNTTAVASRYLMSPTKDASTLTSKASNTATGIAIGKGLIDQWVSAPLAAQTINGTFTGQARFNLSSVTSTTGTGFVYVRVINANGTVASEVTSTVTSNVTATLTNRTLISVPITALAITQGQRLCIELGWSYNIAAAVSRTCTINRGSSSGTDLAVDNFTTTANNPWVQFSQTLLFAPVNDDCTGSTLLTSGATCSSITSNIQYAGSAAPAGACGGATTTTTYDVWFRYVATSTIQTVTLSSLGSNLTAANTYIETLTGACGSFTSLGCQNASTRQTISGLTIGSIYYVRVYVTAVPSNATTANWNFNICVQDQPVNDDCTGAVSLTPAGGCVNTAGTLDLATADAAVPLGCFAAGTYYDVWYKFVATTTIQTVTLSSLGANFTAPRIQIYSGACGALVSVACASATSLQQTGLTVGNTYYVRIANFNVNPSGLGTVANFNICVTSITPPANDDCTGAVLLTSGTSCSTTSGTFINSSPTTGLSGCGNNGSADVWYSFVAQSNRPTITLGSVGSNLSTASPLIQLFTGQCTALVPVTGACGASTFNTAALNGGMGLSINSVYYVRITTNSNTGVPTSGNWAFNICVQDPAGAAVDFAKSYINVTDGTVGGTIDPGDVLEIRAILVVQRPGNAGAAVAIDSVAFYDTLSANKGFHLLNDSMALKTNEGKLFRPTANTYFTDSKLDTDAGWITTAGAGTDTALQINMGTGATRFARGKFGYKSKPSNFGNTCIIMATYRVRVNAVYGTKINYGGGGFSYRDSTTGTFYTVTFPDDSLEVYSSPGACPDAISPTNIVGDEVGGTFGASPGPPTHLQNRGTSPNTNYTYAPFGGGNGPGDYYYSVANNTSASGTTVQTVAKPNAARVFNLWDITGDHTGATNTAKGNPPCNLSQPISPTNPCGYMLVVNSAYRTDKAFEYNFSGACTETYYEISAWIKNICSKCGCDSNGVGAPNAGYVPTGVGDSAGVTPNIAFQINGIDYYTTGDLKHQGLGGTQTGSDTLNKWVKRSFVYKTKPGETSFRMTLRNNAPGGGGNDWAIDDISIRTCYPNMTYSPSSNPTVCAGNTLTVTDTVRSYYNVYIYYKWQRSTDGGVTWTDIPGTNGVAAPVLMSPNNYEFRNSYTIPPSATTPANNGDKYRMVVATNAVNLAGSTCNYSDVFPLTLTVSGSCIDIDDDNDGIPDYVEFNNPVALQDANSNGIPNWKDPTYPGYIDNNFDGVNDNFDYGADSDNDGISNFMDTDFPGFIDTNGDGINDNADKDKDGIPNQYDLDSDNDGIPDVVESYGVDTNGDGVIDNYTDTDSDGFSQNVDANNTGVSGSGNGLGAQDFDLDGIPNYLDTDSDNDGIPDLVEVAGNDSNNNGLIDGFVDANADGYNDNNSFLASALLLTGPDVSPVDGRADNWPFKNLDRDLRPNAYDVDSDGDGIVDVIEAGLPDINLNGIVDGTIGANGWSNSVSALAALNLRNTDGVGNPDYLDIDSDDDGIPDNIEGQPTSLYKLPTTTDTDGDGLASPYDNVVGFSGSGIFVYDHDGDGIPDYRDLDTDADGQPDIVEGNDFNLNGLSDDVVTLTGLDTDGDGLDNRFDSLNSVTNIKGTSYRMGTNGVLIGDPTPGTRATVQKKTPGQTDRDWRFTSVVLPVQFLSFTGLPQGNTVQLNWSVITPLEIDRFEIERSLDNINYTKIAAVADNVRLNEVQNFASNDDITGINTDILYYRLKVISKTGDVKYSSVLIVRLKQSKVIVNMMPNPASNYVTINMFAEKNQQVKIMLIDKIGRKVLLRTENLQKGYNNISLNLESYSEGVYAVVIETPEDKIIKQLMIVR